MIALDADLLRVLVWLSVASGFVGAALHALLVVLIDLIRDWRKQRARERALLAAVEQYEAEWQGRI